MNKCALPITVAAAFVACGAEPTGSWQDQAIVPVSNPIFFETPLIQTEVQPIYIYHRMNPSFLGTEVSVNVYALQLRYAVDDRLEIIATKDGYIQIHEKGIGSVNGWGNLAAGFKYAIAKDEAEQYIITPGLTFELPTGSKAVFQGTGGGVANAFVSAEKGFDKLHLTGNIGFRVPLNWHQDTSSLHYSGQIDCRWFIPFVDINAFTTVSNGKNLPFTTEGFDLVNFGATKASGNTQAAAGLGFRSRILPSADFGVSYERGITAANDIFKDRLTVDFSIRF
jgi:hypothetical protein